MLEDLKKKSLAGRLTRLESLALRLSEVLLTSDVRVRDFVVSFATLALGTTSSKDSLDTLLKLILDRAIELNIKSPKSGDAFITELIVRTLALTELKNN